MELIRISAARRLLVAAALCFAAASQAHATLISVSGTFEAASAIVPALAGGSFTGTFDVNTALLPASPSTSVALNSWDVIVRTSGGSIFQHFQSGVALQSGTIFGDLDGTLRDALRFQDSSNGNRLVILFFAGYDGTGSITLSGTNTTDFITDYSQFVNGSSLNTINVVSGGSGLSVGGSGGGGSATPEPATVTMLGAGAALLFAFSKRSRKQN